MAGSRLWPLLGLLPLFAAAEWGFRALYAERWSPTGAAQWIWATSENPDAGVAFFAVRDFEEGYLVFATEKGTVKKTALQAFRNPRVGGIIAVAVMSIPSSAPSMVRLGGAP